MKLIIIFLFLVISISTQASVIVLGVSMDPDEVQFRFPCLLAQANVVFCDNAVELEDKACQNSLSFKSVNPKKVEISCKLSSGKFFDVGVAQGEWVEDTTQDAFGSVEVLLHSSLQLSSRPNARGKYILRVIQ